MRRIKTEYTFRNSRISQPVRLAVASDLHSSSFDDVLEEFSRCDAVLVPGDLIDRHRKNNDQALKFLKTVPEIVPVFYSIGNHEWKYRRRDEYMKAVAESKVTLLDNTSISFRGIRIGGLSSVPETPDLEFLNRFEKAQGYRLLMCHQPEVYRDYVAGRDIELTVSGHAHGGQIQILGRGLYAPGQGLFPKLTHGIHDEGRLLISRGMTNGAKPRIPRINNPCELIILNLEGKDD